MQPAIHSHSYCWGLFWLLVFPFLKHHVYMLQIFQNPVFNVDLSLAWRPKTGQSLTFWSFIICQLNLNLSRKGKENYFFPLDLHERFITVCSAMLWIWILSIVLSVVVGSHLEMEPFWTMMTMNVWVFVISLSTKTSLDACGHGDFMNAVVEENIS